MTSDERFDLSGRVAIVSRLILWTGPKHSGKTALLGRFVRTLRERGFTPAGFLAPSRYEAGRLTGFDIVDLNTFQQMPLAVRQKGPCDKCGFTLLAEGLKLGLACLRPAATATADIVIVDEYGPLELGHHGWRFAVDRLIALTDAVVLLVVREELADQVRGEYGQTSCVRLPAHESQSRETVVALLRERRIRATDCSPLLARGSH